MYQQENEKLVPMVRQIHKGSSETYGTRRIMAALKAGGIDCGRARINTLMRLAGVAVKRHRRFKVTTDSKHDLPVAPNLLDRNFVVDKP